MHIRGFGYVEELDLNLSNLIDIDLYGLSQLDSECISKMIQPNIHNLRTLELQECMYESIHCVKLFSSVSTLPFLTVFIYTNIIIYI